MAFPLGLFSIPPGVTWLLVNADNPISLPVYGQFDPNIQESRGAPRWVKKPGIAGGLPFLKYLGEDVREMTFEFVALGTAISDLYPEAAWLRINELAKVDSTLGRPPRLYFIYGLHAYEGFITNIPKAPQKRWGGPSFLRQQIIKQIGPVRITFTSVPKESTDILSLFTNFVTRTDETKFEELAQQQYIDARYGQTLRIVNQGVRIGDTVTIPRKSDSRISKVTPIAPYLGDPVEGL